MFNYQFGSSSESDHGPFGSPDPSRGDRHSTFSLIALIAVAVVVAVLAISVGFWLLGIVFSLAGWIVRIAILAAVAALIWRRITRRRSRYHI